MPTDQFVNWITIQHLARSLHNRAQAHFLFVAMTPASTQASSGSAAKRSAAQNTATAMPTTATVRATAWQRPQAASQDPHLRTVKQQQQRGHELQA